MGLLNIIRKLRLRQGLAIREIAPHHGRRGPFAPFANRPVSLRIHPDRLVVSAEGNILCEHRRIIARSHQRPPRTIYDWRHCLAVIQRKPGALRNGAARCWP